MSLVQVYETTNAQRFSAKFDTPIVIPKSGRITLTKAFIPRTQAIVIDATNNTLGIQFHDQQLAAGSPRFYVLTIGAGPYTPQGLCDAINAQFVALKQTWIATPPFNGQFAKANLAFTWDGTHFSVKADCDSIYLDFWAEYNSTLPNNTWDWRRPAPVAIAGQIAPLSLLVAHAGRSVACTDWQDTGGRLGAWNTLWHEGKPIRREYWSATPDPTYAPSYQHPFSGGKWTNSIAGVAPTHLSSYWVGLSENDAAGINVSGVTNGDLSTLTAVTGLDFCVMVASETKDGLTKGKAYVYETDTGAGSLIRRTSDAAAAAMPDIAEGDQICIVLPENTNGLTNHCEYWVKPVAAATWTAADGAFPIPADITPLTRPVPAGATQYYLCGGFYSDTNGVAGYQTIGHEWGFDPDCAFRSTTLGGGFFNEFGRRAQLYLADQDNRGGTTGVEGTIGAGNPPAALTTGIGVTMGFTQPAADLLLSSVGAAALDATVVAQTAAAVAIVNDSRPLVNVNITNLPVVAAAPAFENATTLAPPLTSHGFTRTVACIPRYGGDGSQYLNGHEDEIVSYGDNASTIKLRNVETIQMNSLDFELRNCDGSIPQDLGVPAAFVLLIDGATKGEDDLI